MSHSRTLYMRIPHKNPAPAARYGSDTSGLEDVSTPAANPTMTTAVQTIAKIAPHLKASKFISPSIPINIVAVP